MWCGLCFVVLGFGVCGVYVLLGGLSCAFRLVVALFVGWLGLWFGLLIGWFWCDLTIAVWISVLVLVYCVSGVNCGCWLWVVLDVLLWCG